METKVDLPNLSDQSAFDPLMDKINRRAARICVVGLGYVGLPLAIEAGAVGFPITGLDVSTQRVTAIQAGQSYIKDITDARIAEVMATGRFGVTSDYETIRQADIVFICVPTPFTVTRSPDLAFIVAAAEGIALRLHPGHLIILQSTTHPGTTEEIVLPILEKRTGLKAGVDFYLAFSPERINPGDLTHTVRNTPKVVGGLTPRCTALARAFLEHLTPKVFVVSSPRAAEMTKLLENIFRSVNIALVNELAVLSERMGIDLWEVIAAASTKPFGFMPFYPGPGVGGHCIPVDPYYLSWKAREYDFYTKFIELAAEVNQSMPYHVVDKVVVGLSSQGKALRDAEVLILGVSFKPNVDDARNSPAERVIELLLLARGAHVRYHDPYVPQLRVGGDVFRREETALDSVDLTEQTLAECDVVVIISAHRTYEWPWIVAHAALVIDTVNATHNVPSRHGQVLRIGAPAAIE